MTRPAVTLLAELLTGNLPSLLYLINFSLELCSKYVEQGTKSSTLPVISKDTEKRVHNELMHNTVSTTQYRCNITPALLNILNVTVLGLATLFIITLLEVLMAHLCSPRGLRLLPKVKYSRESYQFPNPDKVWAL